jgi:hypothetical protein
MPRTRIYIDEFNLYYRALKGTPHKWLDISALSLAVLPAGHVIECLSGILLIRLNHL